MLGTLTKIGINASVYKPPADAIWERYFKKFSKNGKLAEEEDGSHGLDTDAPAPAPAPAPVPAPAPAPTAD